MSRIICGLLIAVIAYVALAFLNVTTALQALIALPGSAGLVFALWELLKANIEHQHRLDEKNEENAFILSATSHMAQTAFNKHVAFCEEYLVKVDEGLVVLFRCGPTPDALKIAFELYTIRRKYLVWETAEVTAMLDKFEYAWRSIGADSQCIRDLEGGEERAKMVKSMYNTFKEVMVYNHLPNNATPEIAVANIIANLRKHLGVSELTDLRKHYLAEAMNKAK